MIVTASPKVRNVLVEVWQPLAGLFVWDVLVTVVYYYTPFTAPSLPLTIFGSALALFLGFRVEIDLLEAIGDAPPLPVAAIDGVLW